MSLHFEPFPGIGGAPTSPLPARRSASIDPELLTAVVGIGVG